VSDSILYLAIVAIWAGFLIPAWVRRPHTAKIDQSRDLDMDQELDTDYPADPALYEHPAPTAGGIPADNDTDRRTEEAGPVSEYRDDVHPHSYDSASSPEQGAEPRAHSAPRPSQSREQMMRARRRMFTILAGLTLLTFMFVLTGLVQWWICVPPFAMLVLYVMLLREIAMADAELARKRRAWEAGQARAARAAEAKATAWQRSHQVWEEAEAAAATAEVIDISARVGDQLYDQYADAAVRAVGD
jgi:hypothetical protein